MRTTTRRCVRGDARISGRVVSLGSHLTVTRCVQGCLANGINGGRLLPSGANVRDPNVRRRVARCGGDRLRHGGVITGSDRRGPLMTSCSRDLTSVHGDVSTDLSGFIMALGARLNALRTGRTTAASRVTDGPGRTGCLRAINHRRGIGRTLCLFLLRGHRRGRLSGTFATCGAHVVAPPTKSGAPIRPIHHGVLLVTLMLNFLVPVMIICVHRGTGAAIHNHGSLGGIGMPFLNRVPFSVDHGGHPALRRHVGF